MMTRPSVTGSGGSYSFLYSTASCIIIHTPTPYLNESMDEIIIVHRICNECYTSLLKFASEGDKSARIDINI